ncbi:MAG: HAD family hydrolase [Planctomycetaceae bacterium]
MQSIRLCWPVERRHLAKVFISFTFNRSIRFTNEPKRPCATPAVRNSKRAKVARRILDRLPTPIRIRSHVEEAIGRFAARGFRSLGVAQTDEQGQWNFLGVLPLYDPPREDSKATIATARKMGCAVKMVTGDQLAIGREIATQLDMGRNLVDAKAFQETSRYGVTGRRN